MVVWDSATRQLSSSREQPDWNSDRVFLGAAFAAELSMPHIWAQGVNNIAKKIFCAGICLHVKAIWPSNFLYIRFCISRS